MTVETAEQETKIQNPSGKVVQPISCLQNFSSLYENYRGFEIYTYTPTVLAESFMPAYIYTHSAKRVKD